VSGARLTDPGLTDTIDSSFVIYVALAVVGTLLMLLGMLGAVALPIGEVTDFVGSYAVVYGVISLFDYLSPSQFALLAYFTGGDPEGIPRWLYAGLIMGILSEAGGFILLYHAYVTPNRGAEPLELGASCILLGIGPEPLRYSLAFLKGYWVEG